MEPVLDVTTIYCQEYKERKHKETIDRQTFSCKWPAGSHLDLCRMLTLNNRCVGGQNTGCRKYVPRGETFPGIGK